jgi:hypothetical protein
MAAPNIGRRSRSLSRLTAGFVVIGLVGRGPAARAQDCNANDEASPRSPISSPRNLWIAKDDLGATVGTDGLVQFWSEASSALQLLLVAAGRESTVGVLRGLRGALATTTLVSRLTRLLFPAAAYRPRHRPMASSTVT